MLVSPTINSIHGRIYTPQGTNPIAGAEFSVTVPARRRWRIISFHVALFTNSTVADRIPTLIIDNGSIVLARIPATTPQTASQTHSYFYTGTYQPELIMGVNRFYPLPPLTLVSGYNFYSETVALQNGDDYAAPILLVEEWIDP